MAGDSNGGSYVQFAVFSVGTSWQELDGKEKRKGLDAFIGRLAGDDVRTHIYLLTGLKASADLLLWRIGSTIEALQDSYLALKSTGFGAHLRAAAVYTGITKPSTYTRAENEFESLASEENRKRYLSFYPFTKTNEWYLLNYETRRKIMSDHIAVGKRFPDVAQTLVYSFGADDQEFIVAYEMDDLKYYIDCVMALRESESRRYTKNDTPVYTGVRKEHSEIVRLYGGQNEQQAP